MALLQAAPIIGASTITEAISDWVFKTTGRANITAISMNSDDNRYFYTIRTTEDTYAWLELCVGAGGYVSKLSLSLGNELETHTDNTVAIGEYDIKIINRDLAGML
jgi:hypothetical protein